MRASLKKQLVDQSAHLLAAAAILTPLLTLHPIPGGALSGLGLGLVREITENGSILSKGSLLDLLFWSTGGAFAAALLP